MEKQRLVSELLDGSLPLESEEQVFNSLASDENLRTDFRQQVEIKNAMKKDIKAFVPRAESTVRIFTELGIAGTLVGTVSMGSKIAGWASSYSQAIYSAIATVAITAMAFFGFNGGFSGGLNEGNDSEFANNRSNEQSQSQFASTNKTTAFVEDTVYTVRKIEKESAKIIYRDRYIYTNNPNKLSGQEQISALADMQTIKEYDNHLSTEHTAEIIKEIIGSNDMSMNEEYISDINDLPYSYAPNTSFANLNNFRGRGNSSNDIISSTLAPLQFDFFALPFNVNLEATLISQYNNNLGSMNFTGNNFRLAASIDANEHWAFGLDYRRENYLIQRNDTDEFGDKYNVTKNPNYNFYSLLMKYSPSYLEFEKLSPFVQLTGGVSENGSIATILLGSNYYLTESLSLVFAYNYQKFTPYVNNIGLDNINSSIHFGTSYKIFKD